MRKGALATPAPFLTIPTEGKWASKLVIKHSLAHILQRPVFLWGRPTTPPPPTPDEHITQRPLPLLRSSPGLDLEGQTGVQIHAKLVSLSSSALTELPIGVMAKVLEPPLRSCGKEGYEVSSGIIRSLEYY